jgi:hypothetical protein
VGWIGEWFFADLENGEPSGLIEISVVKQKLPTGRAGRKFFDTIL